MFICFKVDNRYFLITANRCKLFQDIYKHVEEKKKYARTGAMKPEAPSPGPADLIGRSPMLLESRGLLSNQPSPSLERSKKEKHRWVWNKRGSSVNGGGSKANIEPSHKRFDRVSVLHVHTITAVQTATQTRMRYS